MKRVLFLCTGNYYRSRFAELYFNWQVDRRRLSWRAESRGLALDPRNPGPISTHTTTRLAELGIPLDDAPRFPLSAALVDFESAHHVVAVKATEHRSLMQSTFPALVGRVEFWDMHDLDCAGPNEALPNLECEINKLIDRLINAGDAVPQVSLPLSSATELPSPVLDARCF